MHLKSRILFILLIILPTVGLDQYFKVLARQLLSQGQRYSYFGGFINFEYSENPGAFLSLFASFSEATRRLLLVVAVVIFLIGLIVYLLRKADLDQMTLWGYCLLLAGGVGNVIDRIQKGSVTDYIIVGFDWLHTGIFNFADFAIIVAMILLLLQPVVLKHKSTLSQT